MDIYGGTTTPGGNYDTDATWAFHNATKYTLKRDAAGEEQFAIGSPPDPEAAAYYARERSPRPFPFKIYETITPIALRRDVLPSSLPALEAISRSGAEPQGNRA